MKQTPITFQAWKVRKILDWDWSRSTMMTRRVMKYQPEEDVIYGPELYNPIVVDKNGEEQPGDEIFGVYGEDWGLKCPYGQPHDLLWVKESLSVEIDATKSDIECGHFTYKTDDVTNLWTRQNGYRTISARFMPKFAVRIWLEVVSVKVERVQAINRDDARAEGVSNVFTNTPETFTRGVLGPYVANFSILWDSINSKSGFGWASNPFVWVLEFRRIFPKDGQL